MDVLASVWAFVTNLDTELAALMQQYGNWVYGILFAIVFCETGLVVAPFLPGDSLLFVSGALWATAEMPVHWLMVTLVAAALCGDNCNYWIGRFFSARAHRRTRSRLLNRKALDRTERFYAKHGGKTVIMARFVPIVRTFAPFVAGLGHMSYPRFLVFSIIGAMLWVGLLVPAGYWFGNIPLVREHFELVVPVIVVFSLLPLVFEYIRHRRASARAS